MSRLEGRKSLRLARSRCMPPRRTHMQYRAHLRSTWEEVAPAGPGLVRWRVWCSGFSGAGFGAIPNDRPSPHALGDQYAPLRTSRSLALDTTPACSRSEQLFWCTSRALGHPAPHPAPFGSRGEAACGGEGWVDSEAMDAIGEERWGLPGAREGGHVVINGGRNGGRRGVVLVCSLLGVPRALPVTVSSWLCGSNLV